jgi:hypothetical protein
VRTRVNMPNLFVVEFVSDQSVQAAKHLAA